MTPGFYVTHHNKPRQEFSVSKIEKAVRRVSSASDYELEHLVVEIVNLFSESDEISSKTIAKLIAAWLYKRDPKESLSWVLSRSDPALTKAAANTALNLYLAR
jgi:transcriptional regulator NrdR family protein